MAQVRNRKVLGWEEIYKPEVCEEMVGWEDELHMHYEATRLSLSSCFGVILFCTGRMAQNSAPWWTITLHMAPSLFQ